MDPIPAFDPKGTLIQPEPNERFTSTLLDNLALPGQVGIEFRDRETSTVHVNYLQRVIALNDPEPLEEGVATGVRRLSDRNETIEVFASLEGSEA
jgi:hypothetical protein